jgi:quercetin dioxygenase-like cupin family protein
MRQLQISPAEELLDLGELSLRFLITGEESAGTVAMCEMTVPGGEKLLAPGHSHDAYEETIYGIDGELTFTVDGAPKVVGPGDALCIPRGAVHRFDNDGDRPAKVLVVITPAVIGPEYFRQIRQVLVDAAGGPPDVRRIVAIMLAHGLTPVKPGA